MRRFAELFETLDGTTKTNEKVAAIATYVARTLDDAPQDAAWAIWILSGRRLKRLVPTNRLRQWAAQAAGVPDWLFDESYDVVGDLAETITLIVPAKFDDGECATETNDSSLSHWIEERLLPLGQLDEPEQRQRVLQFWRETESTTRLVVMKLITGALRLGVSGRLVARGIAGATQLPIDVIAHRLMGNWHPDEAFIERLTSPNLDDATLSRPYPFCLAHAIPTPNTSSTAAAGDDRDDVKPDPELAGIGSSSEFLAEWKWDGIRAQLIRRGGQTFVWSRGEELMHHRWPEVERAAEFLPDGTTLDGEILASRWVETLARGVIGVEGIVGGGAVEVMPFAELQRRITRKTVGKKLLAEVPVMFHAFDCLQHRGEDIRGLPLRERRERLQGVIAEQAPPGIVLHPPMVAKSWTELARFRQTSREVRAEGLMLKRLDSPYLVGRVRGSWWKWKLSPHTVDAVLIYAQRGHGKRASLYTDYTFAVWRGDELVPFAKAYSGLTDAEIRRVDHFVRNHTSQRFGPVRSVTPQLVMELAFEGLQRSSRHKSGVATRFPRIVRWREDKTPADADHLDTLLALLSREA